MALCNTYDVRDCHIDIALFEKYNKGLFKTREVRLLSSNPYQWNKSVDAHKSQKLKFKVRFPKQLCSSCIRCFFSLLAKIFFIGKDSRHVSFMRHFVKKRFENKARKMAAAEKAADRRSRAAGYIRAFS